MSWRDWYLLHTLEYLYVFWLLSLKINPQPWHKVVYGVM